MLAFYRVPLWSQRSFLGRCCQPPQWQTNEKRKRRITDQYIFDCTSFHTISRAQNGSSNSYPQWVILCQLTVYLLWNICVHAYSSCTGIKLIVKNCNYLCVCVICVPRWPKGLLATNVPHEKMCVVHHNLLHIASDRRRGVDHLIHWTK